MKKYLSLGVIILIVVAGLLVDMDFKNWCEQERVIESDVRRYYGYLPAFFIFDDIKVEKSDYKYTATGSWFWLKYYSNGTHDFGQTYGVAALYAPFFGMGHLCAKWFDHPLTGFSEPYKFFLLLSSLFYLFAGLIFVRKTLLTLRFSEGVTATTLLLLGLGTNLFCYSSQSGPYPHVYVFCLIAVFCYCTVKWHEQRHWSYMLGLSVSLAFISLISLQQLIIVLFFLLYKVGAPADLRYKKIPPVQWLLILPVMLILWLPQLKYWHITTGSYFGMSDADEQFFFTNPVLLKGLFGFQKGWLIYTPLMALAVPGLLLLRKQLPELAGAVGVCFLLTLYVVFSWWNWWYGSSFGQPVLIQSYAVFALPVAATVAVIFRSGKLLQAVSAPLFLFFIGLNIFQTYQYEYQSLHPSGMTADLYFRQFGRLEKIPDFDALLDLPDDRKARNGQR